MEKEIEPILQQLLDGQREFFCYFMAIEDTEKLRFTVSIKQECGNSVAAVDFSDIKNVKFIASSVLIDIDDFRIAMPTNFHEFTHLLDSQLNGYNGKTLVNPFAETYAEYIRIATMLSIREKGIMPFKELYKKDYSNVRILGDLGLLERNITFEYYIEQLGKAYISQVNTISRKISVHGDNLELKLDAFDMFLYLLGIICFIETKCLHKENYKVTLNIYKDIFYIGYLEKIKSLFQKNLRETLFFINTEDISVFQEIKKKAIFDYQGLLYN